MIQSKAAFIELDLVPRLWDWKWVMFIKGTEFSEVRNNPYSCIFLERINAHSEV
jgi:hypothetical protein